MYAGLLFEKSVPCSSKGKFRHRPSAAIWDVPRGTQPPRLLIGRRSEQKDLCNGRESCPIHLTNKNGVQNLLLPGCLCYQDQSDKEKKNAISLTLFYVEDVHFGFSVSHGNNSLPRIINPNLSRTEPHTANTKRGREVFQRKEIRSPGKTKSNSLKRRESIKKTLGHDFTSSSKSQELPFTCAQSHRSVAHTKVPGE